MIETDRFDRQKDIVVMERLRNRMASVVGVGAIGRQVALQLTAMGVPSLQLIDFDKVELTNVVSQGYFEDNIGSSKIVCTAALCKKINVKVMIAEVDKRFSDDILLGDAVFCCVDKMDARQQVWEGAKNRSDFFCDGRMSAEVLRVLTACDEQSRERYPKTLFVDEEAQEDRCTAKAVIYCANIAAGMMVAQFSRYLRSGIPIDHDITLNLLTTELEVGGQENEMAKVVETTQS